MASSNQSESDDPESHESESTQLPVARLCQRCSLIELVDDIVSKAASYPEDIVLWDKPVDIFELIDSWPSLRVLAIAASDGCELCQLLRDGILKTLDNEVVASQVEIGFKGLVASEKLVGFFALLTNPDQEGLYLGRVDYFAGSENGK